MTRPVIALLTDFGTTDPFVGVMKGVIATRCPDATVIDITHAIPPQSIAEGAFWLARSAVWFPTGTVFVAVVDPGVGTERRGVVLAARGCLFVGPDNGLLFPITTSDPGATAWTIDPARLGLPAPSRTFHGRDVFAPVAAELAAGRFQPSDVGPAAGGLTPGGPPSPVQRGEAVEGEVVTVDHFGNLITNLVVDPSRPSPTVELAGLVLPLVGTYAEASPDGFVALINAFGVVEIARRHASAAAALQAARGTRVVLRLARPPA